MCAHQIFWIFFYGLHDTENIDFAQNNFVSTSNIDMYAWNFLSDFFDIFNMYLKQNLKTRIICSWVPKQQSR
jgi:hypothetical protein